MLCCFLYASSWWPLFLFFKQEEVKTLHAHVEEVIKENKSLRDEMEKSGGLRQEDW